MHTDRWNSSEFVIELPQLEFNPETFLIELTVVEQLLFKTKHLNEVQLVLAHNHEKLV